MSPDRILREATIRVLVADNSCMHTRLLADALKRDPVLEVIAFESDPTGLVAAAVAEDVDVVVLSSNLDEQPARGFEVLNELRSLHRATRAVVLMASNDDETILKAFRAGARGLFSKNDAVEMLSECVRSVYQGQDLGEQSRPEYRSRGPGQCAFGSSYQHQCDQASVEAGTRSRPTAGRRTDKPGNRRATQPQPAHD